MSIFYNKEIITVCKADEKFPRHSEASIIELKDSTLLLAWQRFERSAFGSNDDAPGTITLINSADGGRTWTNCRVAVGREDGSRSVYSPNFLRLQDGDLTMGLSATECCSRLP